MDSSNSNLPSLTTKETAKLRLDYPSIEHLEAGNTSAWLQERQDQLLVRAREERAGMNLAKLITVAGATVGAVCYATSPLAPIGALIAGFGYVWSVAQDVTETHQFAPIPFIRGSLFEFLQAMGDSEARADWFAGKNELVDLMQHLEPMERFEFAMLKGSAHVLTDYLAAVDPGKRFYAYRWLLDWFIQLKGMFPTTEQLRGHLTSVTIDPNVNYGHVTAIQEIRSKTHIGIPPAKFAELPQPPTVGLPPAKTSPSPVPAPENWIKGFLSSTCLVWGNQGSGKSWFVRHLVREKIAAGYRVVVFDPNSNKHEWRGVELFNRYEDIEEQMRLYVAEVMSRYADFGESNISEEDWRSQLWAEGKATTFICEEATTYTDFITDKELLATFVKVATTLSRKQEMPAVFVAHNNTQTCLGDIKGLANLIARMQQIQLLVTTDPTTAQPVASGKALIKLDGSDKWIEVLTPKIESKIRDFGAEKEPVTTSYQTTRNQLEKVFKLETTEEPIKDSASQLKNNSLSPEAQTVLSYFDNVKVKSPKSTKDLREANKLRALNQAQLMKALAQLVAVEILDIDEEGNYLKVNW
ncbi:MAG: DUF87 domain-containing protein [Aulosira sp. DedQUE10]|nr:DUF87 domain-containing protein [Aulosira sp. DedQUE10]